MINSIFDECSWNSGKIYQKIGIEKMTAEILNILEITSSEEGFNPIVFNAGFGIAKWITFYNEDEANLSEYEIIQCRNYFDKINFFDKIEKYLYNPYLSIKEITLNNFSTFCGNGNYLIEKNSVYFMKAFEREYYDNSPYLACCCLLAIKKLNKTSFNGLLQKIKNNISIINIITYCFLVNISFDLKNELDMVYKIFCDKIGQLSFEEYKRYISILQQFIINLQEKLRLKDFDSVMYKRTIKYLFENYDDMFLFKNEGKYEEIYDILKNC